MKTFVLMMTWLVSGQPPSSYQVTFSSAEACHVARDAVLADGRRVKAEHDFKSTPLMQPERTRLSSWPVIGRQL